MRVACVNQDSGIAPGRHKGAAIHISSIRRALGACGADVVAIDERTGPAIRGALLGASRRLPIDLIYERLALSATAATQFAIERGIPLVLEMNAPLSIESARWRGTRIEDVRDSEAFVVRRARRIIAVSSAVADYAIELGADPACVDVMPNGVDIERFRPRGANDAVRNELVPNDRFALGFHGRLRPWHGFPRLVEAMEQLLALRLPVHLVLIGAGNFTDAIAGRIPNDRVTRVPWVDHSAIGECVAAFDALPLSYPPDAPCYFSPLKLAEAMACGVVPVVPNLGDLATIVGHGTSGLVYDAGSTRGLVDAIRTLLSSKDDHERLARGARRVAALHSWDRIAASILATGTESRTGLPS